MSYEEILYQVDAPMALITINRADKHNAISLATLDELQQAIRDEYGRDLNELTEDEAWPLLDALASALASLARESSKSADADIEAKLAALRQLRPSAIR